MHPFHIRENLGKVPAAERLLRNLLRDGRPTGITKEVYETLLGPHAVTCDNFADVTTLKLEPHFESYMREAFKPVGVYLDFWQPVQWPEKFTQEPSP